jgi:hypothetical protein
MINLASYWPAWMAIILSLLAGLYQLITEFRKFANLLGPLGRRLYDRSRTRHKMDTTEFNQAVREATAEERERWEKDEARAMILYEGRLKHVSDLTEDQQRELKEVQWQLRCHHAHAEYDSEWHSILQRLIRRAARNGGQIPIDDLPDHIHFSDFEQMCRDNKNFSWRTWGLM